MQAKIKAAGQTAAQAVTRAEARGTGHNINIHKEAKF
jgi:hypothetical protein